MKAVLKRLGFFVTPFRGPFQPGGLEGKRLGPLQLGIPLLVVGWLKPLELTVPGWDVGPANDRNVLSCGCVG